MSSGVRKQLWLKETTLTVGKQTAVAPVKGRLVNFCGSVMISSVFETATRTKAEALLSTWLFFSCADDLPLTYRCRGKSKTAGPWRNDFIPAVSRRVMVVPSIRDRSPQFHLSDVVVPVLLH